MKDLLYIFLGGGIGSCLRFSVSCLWQHLRLLPSFAGMLFPWPTFVVNILGCFLIGLFYTKSEAWDLRPESALLLTTGLCGGLTTFSTFSYESLSLLRTGHYAILGLYVSLSIVLGIIAAFAPHFIMHHS